MKPRASTDVRGADDPPNNNSAQPRFANASAVFCFLMREWKSVMKTVKVHDLKTGRVTEIPEKELAPGMALVQVVGVGMVWINVADVELNGPLLHPPFSPDIIEILEQIRYALREVRPISLKEWEDGFRRDVHAAREIGIWLCLAKFYRRWTTEKVLSAGAKKDIFDILVNFASAPPDAYDAVMETLKLRALTREQAAEYARRWRDRGKTTDKSEGSDQAAVKEVRVYDAKTKTPKEVAYLRGPSAVDRKLIRALQRVLWQVYPLSQKQWEDVFRVEPNLKAAEMAWIKILCFCDCCTKGKHLSLAAQSDIFEIAFALTTTPASRRAAILNTLRLKKLTLDEAKRYIDLWRTGKYFEERGAKK